MFQRLSTPTRERLHAALRGELDGAFDLKKRDAEGKLTAQALLVLAGANQSPISVEGDSPDAEQARRFSILHALLTDQSLLLRRTVELQARDALPLRVVGGNWARLWDGAGDLEAVQSSELDAIGRIEWSAQSSLQALRAEDIDLARERARRAVRMARSEGFVLMEYLTSLVLARVRRYSGRPYLAARVLTTLLEVTPNLWHGWLEYEHLWAVGTSRPTRFAAHAALSSVLEGRAWSGGLPALFQEELDAARFAVQPDVELTSDVPPVVRSWLSVQTSKVPGVLSGLALPSIDADGREYARAHVRFDSSTCRRFLQLAAPGTKAGEYSLSQVRTLTAILELAAARSDGLSKQDLFARTYGFELEPAVHGAALRQLLKRVREALPAACELERRGDQLTLLTSEPVELPDPRCSPRLGSLVLQALAKSAGLASASEISITLGVALRTVQTALQQLVAEGACERIREGRHIRYQLEDTTFWRPTVERLRSPTGAPDV